MGNIATWSVCFQWSVWLKPAMPSGGELRQLRHKHVQTLRTALKTAGKTAAAKPLSVLAQDVRGREEEAWPGLHAWLTRPNPGRSTPKKQ